MATEMQWYVLRAVSGKEAKVKEYIDAEIKNGRFNGHVNQVLIPTEKVVQQRGSKRVVKDRTLMSGYVFVEAELVGEIAHELRQTPNVLGFLGGMENPTPLPMREVNQLLGKMDEMQAENPEMEIPYAIGESVKVIDGPLSGFSGVVEKIDKEKRKLVVVVTVFGRNTPLELGPMQVERK